MIPRASLALVLAAALVAPGFLSAQEAKPPEAKPEATKAKGYKVGDVVKDFTLPDVEGTTKALKEHAKDRKLIVIDFWSPRCPGCRAQEERFTDLDKKYREKGVLVLHIASNRNENRTPEDVAKLKAAMKKNGQTFPALVDVDNKVADAFGAQVTPTLFVIDAATLKVRYAGLVADEDERNYMEEAVTALLEGKDPKVATTRPEG